MDLDYLTDLLVIYFRGKCPQHKFWKDRQQGHLYNRRENYRKFCFNLFRLKNYRGSVCLRYHAAAGMTYLSLSIDSPERLFGDAFRAEVPIGEQIKPAVEKVVGKGLSMLDSDRRYRKLIAQEGRRLRQFQRKYGRETLC